MDVERATGTAVFWTPHSFYDPRRPEPVAVGAPAPNPFEWPPRRRRPARWVPFSWRTYDPDPPVVVPGAAPPYRNGGFGAVPASEKAIAGLPRTTAGEAREKGCSVCMEAFEEEDILRRLHCSHAFHEECISVWLGVSHLCPLCRFALRTQGQEDEEERTGRQ
ncbi:E3 ubiquitin-protein ligase RNF181 homolog [Triticum dicoccoides]|uniref:E3 ubiquitin-protein ligase RNF181 homolog n=1 Tax=Triticum dicoccoides TaxID=85692 RepID=UPI00188E4AA1|nr:E3 ubiquitin-protein ligase RNF181 homolog [Triticum dicoccoides]